MQTRAEPERQPEFQHSAERGVPEAIHDTVAQAFAGILLHAEALGASLGVSKRRSAMALSRIQKLARSGLDEARRSVQALRPKARDGSTLGAALRQEAKRANQTGLQACHPRKQKKSVKPNPQP
jgi:signal transduction histidine kinase